MGRLTLHEVRPGSGQQCLLLRADESTMEQTAPPPHAGKVGMQAPLSHRPIIVWLTVFGIALSIFIALL